MAHSQTRMMNRTALRGGCACASCPMEFMQLKWFLFNNVLANSDGPDAKYVPCLYSNEVIKI